MKQGFRWVVGDGKVINIFKDRWLRGKSDFCVDTSYNTLHHRDAKVSEFFVTDSKVWDEGKVRSSFSHVDAEAMTNRIAWVHSSNGQYSVKSGYQFWLSNQTSITDVQQSDGWGRLWRLCVPHKVRVLLWRICRNTVPVRNKLRGKGVHVPITCMMCTRDIEHLLHLFFDCTFASACWQHMGISYDMREVESAPEWLLNKLSIESTDTLVKIATVLWGVWWARNKKVWEGQSMSPNIAMSWSSSQIADWRNVQNKRTRILISHRWPSSSTPTIG